MTFERADACNLRDDIGQFGCVLGANVLCRLPTPLDFLGRLPSLVVPGGIVALVSPYTWLEEYTSKVWNMELCSMQYMAGNLAFS